MSEDNEEKSEFLVIAEQRRSVPVTRPISQTAFYISGVEPFERAVREAVNWMRQRTVEVPVTAINGEPFRVGAGAAYSAEAIAVHSDGLRLWAATLEDQREAKSHGRTWVTEITVGQRGSVGALGVRLSQVIRGADGPYYPSRPNCVFEVLQHVTAKIDGFELGNEAHEVTNEAEALDLIKLLSKKDRRLPVVVMSRTESGQSAVDVDEVCRRLSGLAHFFVLSPMASWVLTNELTKSLSVFLGSTRLYRPSFNAAEANPFDHPLWRMRTGTREEERRNLGQISSLLATMSIRTFSGISDFPRYEDVRRFVAQQAVVARKSAGAGDAELAALYSQENENLRQQLETLKSEHEVELQYASDELLRAEARRDEALAERWALRARIHMLEETVKNRNVANEHSPLSSYEDIETWTEQYLAGSIWIAPKAIRETEKNGQFEDIKLFGDTLLMLRDLFVPMKREPGPEKRQAYETQLLSMSLTDQPCFSQRGAIRNFPEYRVDYQGEQFWCEDHIKFGGGWDPRNQFRIYYHWHVEDRILLIGHMPTHLDNMRTN